MLFFKFGGGGNHPPPKVRGLGGGGNYPSKPKPPPLNRFRRQHVNSPCPAHRPSLEAWLVSRLLCPPAARMKVDVVKRLQRAAERERQQFFSLCDGTNGSSLPPLAPLYRARSLWSHHQRLFGNGATGYWRSTDSRQTNASDCDRHYFRAARPFVCSSPSDIQRMSRPRVVAVVPGRFCLSAGIGWPPLVELHFMDLADAHPDFDMWCQATSPLVVPDQFQSALELFHQAHSLVTLVRPDDKAKTGNPVKPGADDAGGGHRSCEQDNVVFSP